MYMKAKLSAGRCWSTTVDQSHGLLVVVVGGGVAGGGGPPMVVGSYWGGIPSTSSYLGGMSLAGLVVVVVAVLR